MRASHRSAFVAVMVAAVAFTVGCAVPEGTDAAGGSSSAPTALGTLRPDPEVSASAPRPSPTTTSATVPTTASSTSPPPAPAADVASYLAPLAIDDLRSVPVRYDRDDWGGWSDTDGDGCDGRNQALIAASISPAQVDRIDCTVVAGDWFSDYDGFVTADPSDLDVDHLVSLSEAHAAGGWQWSAPVRRQFANDQSNLWVVSASANRSKSDDGPHEWRPQRTEVWCDYAVRWVEVKVAWGLSATTSERDALGSMLSRCTSLPPPPRPR